MRLRGQNLVGRLKKLENMINQKEDEGITLYELFNGHVSEEEKNIKVSENQLVDMWVEAVIATTEKVIR